MPNLRCVGHSVAVVATSRYDARFVPIHEATLFALFPEMVDRGNKRVRVTRLGNFRPEIVDGRLTLRCTRWWDASAIHHKKRQDPRAYARPARMLAELTRAEQNGFRSPFGRDLLVYLDTSSSRRDVDWDVLTDDVFRGMASRVPFQWTLSRRQRERIVQELPFVDFEHFESVVPPGTLISLVRQLIEQHTLKVGGTALLPLRWVGAVRSDDVIMVDTRTPMVIRPFDINSLTIDVGALNVVFRRKPTSAR